MLQALFEEDQEAYTTVSVLEEMGAFKCHMQSYDVLKNLSGQCIMVC